jgi:pSer/pThr/pTyr-binding forkhead associated (FHA) protein
MGRERGWVSVSVQTYQSHRASNSSQRVLQQEYTVDEAGATLNALARNSDPREEEELAAASSQNPSTSIFIRDWKARSPLPWRCALGQRGLARRGKGGRLLRALRRQPACDRTPLPAPARSPPPRAAPQLSGRRAFIRFDREDSNFWFNPVVDEHKSSSSTPGFPCSRGDIFLKLGMRGARLIPWRLRQGDVFRLGQAYVLVSQIRLTADAAADVSAFSALSAEEGGGGGEVDADTDVDEDEESADSKRPQCYICYEHGVKEDPLINLCQCTGSVKFVHMNCLQRWMQPEGSSAVNTHCPICKTRYPEKAQAMMIRPPALLLESWSNHRALKLRHWVSFSQHSTASLGRFAEQNDVVIPDHSVSGEHAFIVHQNDQFWLHDRESSNGSFIRLCTPLRLTFGESLQLKMGKSLLSLHAKRSRWSRLRMRLSMLRFGESSERQSDEEGSGRERGASQSSVASAASEGACSSRSLAAAPPTQRTSRGSGSEPALDADEPPGIREPAA